MLELFAARFKCLFTAKHPATSCDILRHPATSCDILRHPATSCDILRHPTTSCDILRHPATSCDILRHPATACDILRHPATSCDILRHPATSCDILRHPATSTRNISEGLQRKWMHFNKRTLHSEVTYLPSSEPLPCQVIYFTTGTLPDIEIFSSYSSLRWLCLDLLPALFRLRLALFRPSSSFV